MTVWVFIMTILPMLGYNFDFERPAREVATVTRTLGECLDERRRAFAVADLIYDLRFGGVLPIESVSWDLVSLDQSGCRAFQLKAADQ